MGEISSNFQIQKTLAILHVIVSFNSSLFLFISDTIKQWRIQNFPQGGVDLVWRRGGADSQGSNISKILYVETKESGSLRGRAPGTPPRSANAFSRSAIRGAHLHRKILIVFFYRSQFQNCVLLSGVLCTVCGYVMSTVITLGLRTLSVLLFLPVWQILSR